MANSNRSEEYKNVDEKTYTKHELNDLIEDKPKKASKKESYKQELHTFENMNVSK